VNRSDVEASRALAIRYVKACEELLAKRAPNGQTWDQSWIVGGKVSGAHRRLSLDLTRALAHMRRRR
jgi:hypothetical protein